MTLRLRGTLDLGPVREPVDYSPDRPPPVVTPVATFLDVTALNTDLNGGVLRIPGSTMSIS